MELEHKYAEVNGLRLHYVTAGSGPMMLFLHGFPEFWYAWKDLLAEFSQDHTVVAPDLPGYNLSDKPEDVAAYAIPRVATAIRGLLDQINPGGKVVLVAHDWGGVTAWLFAALFPDYLERLVIFNAPHPTIRAREMANNPAQQAASGYMARLAEPNAEAGLAADDYAMLGRMLIGTAARPDVFTEADRTAYHEAWSQPGALTGMLNYYRALRPTADAIAAAAVPPPTLTIRVPTLVIWGEADPVMLVGYLDGLDEVVPDLQIQRIPTGTHWVVHEEPALISQYIRAFLGA